MLIGFYCTIGSYSVVCVRVCACVCVVVTVNEDALGTSGEHPDLKRHPCFGGHAC